MHGDAGIGGHPDGLLLMGVYQRDLPLQRLIGGETLPHHGHDPLARRGQPDAPAIPEQHGEADLPLQTVHHVGQPRLGVAQLLRRPGEAALIHRRGQRCQLFCVHERSPFRIACFTIA